jgi:hypothetical protein
MSSQGKHDTSKAGSFSTNYVDKLMERPGISTPHRLLKCLNPACCTGVESEDAVLFNSSSLFPNVLGEVICCKCSIHWTVCLICDNIRVRRFSPGLSRPLQDHLRQCHQVTFDTTLRIRTNIKQVPNQALVNRPPLLDGHSPYDVESPSFDNYELTETDTFSDQQSQVNEDLPPFLEPDADDAMLAASTIPVVKRPSDVSSACRHASREFFFKNQTEEGMPYLASRAQFGLPNIESDALDPKEVRMLLEAAELAASLPRMDRDRLARYTKSVVEVVRNQTLEEIEVKAKRQPVRPWAITPITTSKQMRRQMKDGSKDSIMYTVPHPEVVVVGSHAVSLPSDCLQDLVGHGFPLDFVPSVSRASEEPLFPVTGLSTTPICKNLFPDQEVDGSVIAEYNVWIIEWSDDFEPNSSLTKSNRGGVWVKTITICPPRSFRHLQNYTYPVAMGPKNANHEEAEKSIHEDMNKLSSPQGMVLYSVELGGLIRIRGKYIVSLQDQPERRGENYLTSGSFSTYHRRFGYSFPWQEFGPVLRPCRLCREGLFNLSVPWMGRNCDDCTNFAHDPQHPLLTYPHVLDSTLRQSVIQLSYQKLADAVHLAHDGFVSGHWTATDVHEWLRMHCILKAACNSILLHADKCREYQEIMDVNSTASDSLKEAVTQEKNRNPKLYEPWPLPAVWTRGVLLHQHPDVPMHLICLGVVKSVIMRIDKWMTKSCKGAPFVKHMKGYLESLQDLNLCWCPILPYKGGKFGGWVSENFLTMSRLLKWFYGVLDEIAPDAEPWSEPNKPMKDWLGKDCKMWLKIRGLPQTGNAPEHKAKVTTYRSMPIGEQPKVVEQLGGPVEKVLEVIVALDEMVSWLMVDQIDGEPYYQELERKIRIFLTVYAEMDDKLTRKNALPTWLTAYNFLSLLNLPDIVRLYGPIRNIWEGSWVGEGFLRFIKPAMIHGLRKNWEKSTMTSLMRMKGMQVLTKGLRERTSSDGVDIMADEEEGLDSGKKSYHCYQSLLEVDDLLRKATKVISGIIVDGQLGVACNDLGEECFFPLTRRNLHSQKMGHCYFRFLRDLQGDNQEPHKIVGARTIQQECLLLPLIQMLPPQHDRFVLGVYTVVDRSHRWLNANGNLHR